jgi:hypothetical protein
MPFGGRGGRVTSAVQVTPGEALQVNVGGFAGWNGGGTGSVPILGSSGARFYTAGGGASDVRRGGTGLATRVVVAGGGGGGGFRGDCSDDGGGAGGGTSPGAGDGHITQTRCATSAGPGRGGTPEAAGQGGAGGPGGEDGESGSFGQGGARNGGGGYYGGGGGGYVPHRALGEVAPGGGGSSAGPEGSTFWPGVRAGNGEVTITVLDEAEVMYTSVYSAAEVRHLYLDTVRLGTTSLAATQKAAGQFMVFLHGFVTGTPPTFGPNLGSGPLSVTSTYTAAEDAQLEAAATGLGTEPQSLQRIGVLLLAYLFGLSS